MPKNPDIKKVLVLGSGPIIIGQAAEFDYAGTQACRSLKEEGIEVVLLNSNPATIMTDKDIADRVYIEPLTVEVVEQLILKEKPDQIFTISYDLSNELALTEPGDRVKISYMASGTGICIATAFDNLEFKQIPDEEETAPAVPEPAATESSKPTESVSSTE